MKPIEGLSFIVIAVGNPESATVRKQYGVLPKVFGAAFFKKGQFASAVLQQSQQPAHKYAEVVTYGISNYADA